MRHLKHLENGKRSFIVIMDPKKKRKRTVHKELKGFDINVNPFGELESTMDIDKINEFLNKNLEDKKLISDDLPLEEE